MANIKDTAVESCINTLQQLGIQMQKTTPSALNGEAIHIQIEFVGDVSGYVILETTHDLACKLANVMLQGMMEVTDVDDMCKSVLQELTNMISGGISTCLDTNLGQKTDIKPPILDIRAQALPSDHANSLQYSCNGQIINMFSILK